MERRMSSMTQMEIAKIIGERKPVILPTGATEAHGPHMPTDTPSDLRSTCHSPKPARSYIIIGPSRR